jgi:hypothetical protein
MPEDIHLSAHPEDAAHNRELRKQLAAADAETGRLSVELMVALDRLDREHRRGNDLERRLNEALDTISHMERSWFWKLRQLWKRIVG